MMNGEGTGSTAGMLFPGDILERPADEVPDAAGAGAGGRTP
jgi:hypothetical protein